MPFIHDYIYDELKYSDKFKHKNGRKKADLIFKVLMKREGMRADQVFFAFWFVRLFGGLTWNKWLKKV
jgi:hypothetical protein